MNRFSRIENVSNKNEIFFFKSRTFVESHENEKRIARNVRVYSRNNFFKAKF